SPGLCGRFVRTASNHAPIGEYRERFFPREPPQGCHGVLNAPETRAHILNRCSWYVRRANHYEGGIETVMGLNLFLMDNPHAFSFDRAVQPRLFDQDWKAYRDEVYRQRDEANKERKRKRLPLDTGPIFLHERRDYYYEVEGSEVGD